MWVVKSRGETWYVNHVDCHKGWSTKETPDSTHTKGAIKVKDCLLVIDNDNCATIRDITDDDRRRLQHLMSKPIRFITRWGQKLRESLAKLSAHGPIKIVDGGCGTAWYISEVDNNKLYTYLSLLMSETDIRQLKENEDYYKLYEKSYAYNDTYISDDDWEDLYED